nr:delta(3,5)-delta(2,4)-dienoyl-CoA isomerase, peroxisomal [Tanacetum cinerariifolium]
MGSTRVIIEFLLSEKDVHMVILLPDLLALLLHTFTHARICEHYFRIYHEEAVSAIEKCRKVVVAAVQGACIGGGIDIITAWTLQRLPKIVGFGNTMELALTGRVFGAEEAKWMGLVSKVFGGKNELDQGVRAIAQG